MVIHAIDHNTFLNIVKPNPFTNQVEILVNAPQEQRVTVKLTDAAGRIIRQQQNTIVKGANIITLRQLNNLPVGTYFLKITGNKSILLQQKLLKNAQ